jgi:hypothetical protein
MEKAGSAGDAPCILRRALATTIVKQAEAAPWSAPLVEAAHLTRLPVKAKETLMSPDETARIASDQDEVKQLVSTIEAGSRTVDGRAQTACLAPPHLGVRSNKSSRYARSPATSRNPRSQSTTIGIDFNPEPTLTSPNEDRLKTTHTGPSGNTRGRRTDFVSLLKPRRGERAASERHPVTHPDAEAIPQRVLQNRLPRPWRESF